MENARITGQATADCFTGSEREEFWRLLEDYDDNPGPLGEFLAQRGFSECIDPIRDCAIRFRLIRSEIVSTAEAAARLRLSVEELESIPDGKAIF